MYPNTYTFAPGSELIIAPGVKIRVKDGVELIFKNTKITTCEEGDFWGGIEVGPGAILRILDGCEIEHMCGGINLLNGAKCEIVGSETAPNIFRDNYPTLWVQGNVQLLGKGIAANKFSNTISLINGGCSPNGTNPPQGPYHIFLDGAKRIKIGAIDADPKKWQNTFSNAVTTSIRAENSNVDIVNSSFTGTINTISSLPIITLKGKGATFIANITGLGTNPDDDINGNTFRNAAVGIQSENYNLTLKNAKFYSVDKGIVVSKPSETNNASLPIKVTVQFNKFKSFYSEAIKIADVPILRASVTNNTSYDDGSSPFYQSVSRKGILWENNTMVGGVRGEIVNNTYYDDQKPPSSGDYFNSYGLAVNNSSYIKVNANKSYQNYLPGSLQDPLITTQQEYHDFRGIWLYKSKNNLLLDNTSVGNFGASSIISTNPDDKYYYRGIRMEESGATLLKCNHAEGMNQGINFKGVCVSSHMVRSNTMTNNKVGLYLYNGTTIGRQFNQDNKWPGATGGSDFEAKFDGAEGNPSLTFLSRFEINDPNINSDYWAAPRSPQDWFLPSPTYPPHLDCAIGPADPGGDKRSESDLRAISGTFPNYKGYPGSGFDANLNAYEVLHNNPGLMVSGSPDAAFFNTHQYGNLGKIFRAKNDLEHLGKVTAAFEATWISNMDSIDQALNDIAVQDSLYRESADTTVQQQAAQNLTALYAQLTALQQTNQSLSAQYAAGVAAKAAQLSIALDSITPSNVWEQNLKTVMFILLQQVTNGTSTWTAVQYDTLNAVAGQCRHEGGIAVVMARAALRQFNYNDEEMCPGYVDPRKKTSGQALTVVKMAPNPADKQSLLSFEHPVSGTLSVRDLQGRESFRITLNQSAFALVDTKALPNGVYLLHLLDNQNVLMFSEKLVVLH